VPQYPAGFSAEEYDELKAIVERLGQDGPFDANDLLEAYVAHRAGGAPVNAGSVAQILDDLVDLGIVRRAPDREETVASRYELA